MFPIIKLTASSVDLIFVKFVVIKTSVVNTNLTIRLIVTVWSAGSRTILILHSTSIPPLKIPDKRSTWDDFPSDIRSECSQGFSPIHFSRLFNASKFYNFSTLLTPMRWEQLTRILLFEKLYLLLCLRSKAHMFRLLRI